jgi:hypothetical protein
MFVVIAWQPLIPATTLSVSLNNSRVSEFP